MRPGRLFAVVAVWLGACTSTPGFDAGTRCENDPPVGLTCVTLSAPACGGTGCDAGEECCNTTGACTVIASGTCPAKGTTLPNARACGSNSECGDNELCVGDDPNRCLGSGHCQAKNNCGVCSPPGSPQCQACGCDGVTYDSIQAACAAGVRTAGAGACGGTGSGSVTSIRCGLSSQCPSGASCCQLTGRCFAASEPWRCEEQPDGSVFDCATSAECSQGAGGGPGEFVCEGEGCTGPGLCAPTGGSADCGGVLAPVCGCDGTSYDNACSAQANGVRVASQGTCDGGP